MKKYLTLLLALVVILSAVSAYGEKKTESSATALEFELETVCGDVSAAEGLEVKDFGSYMSDAEGQSVVWSSDVAVRNGELEWSTELITDNRYEILYGDYNYLIRYPGNHGYGIRARFDAMNIGQTMNNPVMNSFFSGFSKRDDAKDYLIRETDKPLGGYFYRIDLAEFYEYYPYLLEIDLPEDFNVTEESFREFFKIPVLRTEKYKLRAVNNVPQIYDAAYTGDPYEPEDIETDFAQIDTFGGLTDDAYYFTFSNKTRKGGRFDTSQIPLGYGIYRLSKDGTFSLYKALPDDAVLRNFGVDRDGKTMYLHYVENNKWTVHVIDIASGSEINSIAVKDYYTGDLTPKVFHGNGGEVIAFLEQDWSDDWGGYWYASEVYVVNGDDARLYVDNTFSIDHLDNFPYQKYVLRGIGVFSATVLDDKLAIVKRIETSPIYEQNESAGSAENAKIVGYDPRDNAFMIMIFGPDGLEYCGRCRCSLDKASVIGESGITTTYKNGSSDTGLRYIWQSNWAAGFEDYYLTW